MSETPPRTATADDCKHACSDKGSSHHSWCVDYEFVVISRTSSCRLFDDCTETIEATLPPPTSAAGVIKEVAASPSPTATTERCMRVEDIDFDRWSLAESPPRTATEADCKFACTDEASGHGAWCKSYQFLTSAPGAGLRKFTSVCRLFADGDCPQVDEATPSPSPVAAAAPSPVSAAERCLRVADADFDRWFLSEHPPRTATDADCNAACTDEASEHHAWCVGYEFVAKTAGAGTRDFSSTCRLYAVGVDDCGEQEKAEPTPAKEEVAPSPSPAVFKRRCMRIEDKDMDRWFLSEHPPRTATDADCSAACWDEASEHHSWCIGYEFLTGTAGAGTRDFSTTCRLFDDCVNAADDGAAALSN